MITLPPLPYAKNALEPYISERTMTLHYEKHHQGYVTKLNSVIQGTEYENLTLEEIMTATFEKPFDKRIVFANAAQTWNHTFFWNCMTPNYEPLEDGPLKSKLIYAFGSVEEFIDDIKDMAMKQFGSGWAWLVFDLKADLGTQRSNNADCPLMEGFIPMCTVDVWEHAYYLEFENRRSEYLDMFFSKLINWKFVEENYLKALHR